MSGILQTLFLGAAAAVKDAYFNLVTLLLNTTATNGAQNNTFLDSSSNNFSITRNGNTTQGTFTPFSQTGWSNYFGGASNYLSISDNAAFDFGTGNFCVEFWFNAPNQTVPYPGIISSSGYPGALSIRYDNTGYDNKIFVYMGGGGDPVIASTSTIANNTWAHVAVVRDSTTSLKIYINGTQDATATISSSLATDLSNGPLYIGRGFDVDGTNAYFTGYVSNARVTKGGAVYTSNFTPSTVPLTATVPSGSVSLLTCQSNRFVDNSANNFTLTANGTPSVQAFSPFAPAYITPTTYSNWFDGSGDYLTAPNAGWMNLGTGSFTMECWVQFNTVASTQMFVSSNYDAGTGGGGWAFLYRQDNTTLKFSCNSNVSFEKTWSPVVGTMYHVAVCRSGTDLRLFVNGTQVGTTSTSSDNISGSSTLFVGSNASNPLPINGVISNLRIVTSALYTSNFTPPTSPLTAVANTQFLSCQSSTFVDNSTNAATITSYGNAQPVSSPTPFAPTVETEDAAYDAALVGGSGYYDGSGDYLAWSGSSIGTNQFCFECWFYNTGDFTSTTPTLLGIANTIATAALGVRINSSTTISIDAYGVAAYNFTVPTMYVNTWYHVAVVRGASNLCAIFLNGVRSATQTLSNTFASSSSIGFTNASEPRNFTGYISNVRLVVGSTPYDPTQTGFAPPLTPPTAITNTQLLLLGTNAGIYDSAAKNDLETVGNAQVSTTQAKWGTTSMYFDGSGDYLIGRSTDLLSFGTGDFTIEMWINPDSIPASDRVIMDTRSSGSDSGYTPYINGGTLKIYSSAADRITSTSTIAANVWSHVAFVRASGTLAIYINGVQSGTATYTGAMTCPGRITIAAGFDNAANYNGYIDDFRVTKGFARYTATFTPPAAAFPIQ